MILDADFGLVMIERMKGPHQNRLCFLVTFFAQAKKVGRGQARPDRAYRQAGSREQETEVLREPLCTLCLRGYFTTETRRSQEWLGGLVQITPDSKFIFLLTRNTTENGRHFSAITDSEIPILAYLYHHHFRKRKKRYCI